MEGGGRWGGDVEVMAGGVDWSSDERAGDVAVGGALRRHVGERFF